MTEETGNNGDTEQRRNWEDKKLGRHLARPLWLRFSVAPLLPVFSAVSVNSSVMSVVSVNDRVTL